MQTFQTGDARIYDSRVRDFISDKHRRFAEILHDYNPTLSLEFVPSMDRDETDTKPFRIKETPTDGRAPHVVRYLTEREMDDPIQVLEWIWEGDFRKHSPDAVFNRLEARRIAQELMEEKRLEDEREARVDLLSNLVSGGKDGLHYYRHNGTTFRR